MAIHMQAKIEVYAGTQLVMPPAPSHGARFKDLTGRQYGALTVIREGLSERGMVRWECICDCGKRTVVQSSGLTSGHTKSCGHLRHPRGTRHHNFRDLTGKRYGKLSVIRLGKPNRWGQSQWEVVCDCGRTKTVGGNSLKRGLTKSCGCGMVKRGAENPRWKGGVKVYNGYRFIYVSEPSKIRVGAMNVYLPEHAVVMSTHLGRPLLRGETVHHKNGNRQDNRIENLDLMPVNRHPAGQRAEDLVKYAHDIISQYDPPRLGLLDKVLNLAVQVWKECHPPSPQKTEAK